MREVRWQQFKLSPMKCIKGQQEIKVNRAGGCYFLVRHFSPYIEDGGVKVVANMKKKRSEGKVPHRCTLCGAGMRVKFVIPFNAVMAPGWYCYNCRRKHELLDIKIAKKHNKLI